MTLSPTATFGKLPSCSWLASSGYEHFTFAESAAAAAILSRSSIESSADPSYSPEFTSKNNENTTNTTNTTNNKNNKNTKNTKNTNTNTNANTNTNNTNTNTNANTNTNNNRSLLMPVSIVRRK